MKRVFVKKGLKDLKATIFSRLSREAVHAQAQRLKASISYFCLHLSWKGFCLLFLIFFLFIVLFQACLRAELKEYEATPLLEDRQGNFLSEGEKRYAQLGFWDVAEEIPFRIKKCVIIVEDKRFELHMGLDLWSLGRALVNNLSGNGWQGASTIAMQVARMQQGHDRTLLAKLDEMLLAWFMLLKYGHEAVLRQYLKIAPLGNQIYGFAYAARRYFKKPLVDLNWAEAALLAALPKSPSLQNLFNYWGFQKAKRRAQLILRLLFEEKELNTEEYQEALNRLSEMAFRFRETRPETSYHFTFRVLEELKKKGQCKYRQPLRTSLDLSLQNSVQELCDEAMENYRRLGARNIAVIVVSKETGEVLSYLGSQNYYDEFSSGSINYAHTPRSSGSTVKPFLYALGLELGVFSPSSILADLPFAILGPKGEYSIGNFDDEYLGPMIYRRALANSRNIPTLRVLEGVGLERAFEFFIKCHLVDNSKGADYYGYGLPLGGLYVTLEDLVRAYGILANNGFEFSLHWFANEKDTSEPTQILSSYTSCEITDMLADPLARQPSFPRLSPLEFPFPVAVKTGTSLGYRDAWAIGYSSKYVVGVWIGDPDNACMNRVSGSLIATLFHEIMLHLHPQEKRGINSVPFPLPPGSVAVEICSLSGKVKGSDCPDTIVEYFKDGTEPHAVCDVHRRYLIDNLTGELITGTTPAIRVGNKVFTVLPPEYASWGAKHGFGKPPVGSTSKIKQAEIKITHPLDGAIYVLDPEVPTQFQTIALRAEVTPLVPFIVWYLDGKELARAEYPYEIRLPLELGKHSIQARFPHAFVASPPVFFQVDPY